MTDILQTAEALLLDSNNISEQQLEKTVNRIVSAGIDYADIYLQSSWEESWFLEDGIVKEGGYSFDSGFGLRAISGETIGFAQADTIALPSLSAAAQQVRSIARQGTSAELIVPHSDRVPILYPSNNPIDTLTSAKKIELLQFVDQYLRAKDPRVKQVMSSLTASHDVVLMYATDGSLVADMRPLVHVTVSIVVEHAGRTEKAQAGGGARADLSVFADTSLLQQYADKALASALLSLEARPFAAGVMPVVLGPGWPGVLLHEAVGHGLEGDFIRRGSSAFTDKLGQQVASPLCTIVDDATLPGRRGSVAVDDEGVQGQCTTLIENGFLKGYMLDKHNAKLMGLESTGNGRRESYSHQPLPRMTNTYMLAGESDPKEIIASIDRGLYAVDFSGGQVDITSGKFVFSMSEAYFVENGKIQYPVKGATLIGDGPSILHQVSMVGNDLELDSGIGTCGKDGQGVPVGVGQPTLRLDAITVGGSVG